MTLDTQDPGHLRLPSRALAALLEAARDGEALRAAGRAIGETLAAESVVVDSPEWESVAATWERAGLGTLRRERPRSGVWLLVLVGAPADGADGSAPFWEGLVSGLLESLAGEPVDAAALPPGVGPEIRLVAGAPAPVEKLRHGFAAGWTLERMLEEA